MSFIQKYYMLAFIRRSICTIYPCDIFFGALFSINSFWLLYSCMDFLFSICKANWPEWWILNTKSRANRSMHTHLSKTVSITNEETHYTLSKRAQIKIIKMLLNKKSTCFHIFVFFIQLFSPNKITSRYVIKHLPLRKFKIKSV